MTSARQQSPRQRQHRHCDHDRLTAFATLEPRKRQCPDVFGLMVDSLQIVRRSSYRFTPIAEAIMMALLLHLLHPVVGTGKV